MTDYKNTNEDRISARIQDFILDLQSFTHGISNASLVTIRKKLTLLIAAIDEKLSEQIILVLRHENFQQLESSWRGLHYLVRHTARDELLKIKVMNITKKELQRTLRLHKYAPNKNPLFIKLGQIPYTEKNGEPFSCLIGDYYFGTGPQDIESLSSLAEICASSHFPFIGGGEASLVGFRTWIDLSKQTLGKLRQYLKNYVSIEKTASQYPLPQRAWHYLRESEKARYLYLTAPRFLARLPYGMESTLREDFTFKEELNSANCSQYTWINASYVMGVIINRAFSQYRWCFRIRGYSSDNDGSVEDTPTVAVPWVGYTNIFSDERSETNTQCCTEVAIHPDGGIAELLGNAGLLPFVAHPSVESQTPTHYATIYLMNSVHKPMEFEDPIETAKDRIVSCLNHLLPVWRFAHYLRCIVRDNLDYYRSREHMELYLHDWIQQYVHDMPDIMLELQRENCYDISGNCEEKIEAMLASIVQKPLAEAKIKITEDQESQLSKHEWIAKCIITPLYQMSTTASFKVIFRLPKSLSQ